MGNIFFFLNLVKSLCTRSYISCIIVLCCRAELGEICPENCSRRNRNRRSIDLDCRQTDVICSCLLGGKKNYAYGFETYVFQYVDLFSNIEHYIQILFLSISDIFMLRISEFLPKKLKRKFVKHDVLQNLYIERKHIFDLMLILNFMLLFALLKQTKIIYIIL